MTALHLFTYHACFLISLFQSSAATLAKHNGVKPLQIRICISYEFFCIKYFIALFDEKISREIQKCDFKKSLVHSCKGLNNLKTAGHVLTETEYFLDFLHFYTFLELKLVGQYIPINAVFSYLFLLK